MILPRSAAPRATDGFVVHPVAERVEVHLTRTTPSLSPVIEAEIDRLWTAALDHTPDARLFNGAVFSADSIGPRLIAGHMTEYRRLVAQILKPDLFADLGLRVLAACGAILSPDGFVFGRRPSNAIYQPGLWQLIPAGSVDRSSLRPDDRLDVRAQLLTELSEESGLRADDIVLGPPICVVEHPFSHVADLGFAIRTHLTEAQIRERHRAAGNEEYVDLRFIPDAALHSWLTEQGDAVSPSAAILLARYPEV